jgi:hypothetical protein
MTGGVAIRAHHDLTRKDVSVFRQDLVTNAALVSADVMKFLNSLLGDKIPQLLLVRGGLGSFRRDTMVEDDRNFVRIPYPRLQTCALINLLELIEHQGPVFM